MFKGKRWDLISYGLIMIAVVLLVAICSTGCMSVLSEEDWTRFGSKMEDRLTDAGISREQAKAETDEAINDLQEVEAMTVEKINALGKQIKDLGIDIVGGMAGMPDAVKNGTKDWTDDLMKWLLLGGTGAGILGAGGLSIRNSREKKLFGPVFNGKKETDDKIQKLTAIQEEIMRFMSGADATKKET